MLGSMAGELRRAVQLEGVTAADLHRDLQASGMDVSLRTVQRTCYHDTVPDCDVAAVAPEPGSWLRGERSPNAKLRAEEVRAIRSREGKESSISVGRRYRITHGHVRNIWAKRRRAHD